MFELVFLYWTSLSPDWHREKIQGYLRNPSWESVALSDGTSDRSVDGHVFSGVNGGVAWSALSGIHPSPFIVSCSLIFHPLPSSSLFHPLTVGQSSGSLLFLSFVHTFPSLLARNHVVLSHILSHCVLHIAKGLSDRDILTRLFCSMRLFMDEVRLHSFLSAAVRHTRVALTASAQSLLAGIWCNKNRLT